MGHCSSSKTEIRPVITVHLIQKMKDHWIFGAVTLCPVVVFYNSPKTALLYSGSGGKIEAHEKIFFKATWLSV